MSVISTPNKLTIPLLQLQKNKVNITAEYEMGMYLITELNQKYFAE